MSDEWPKRHPPGGKPEWGVGYNRYPSTCTLCGAAVESWAGVLWPEIGRFHVICDQCWNNPSIPSIQAEVLNKVKEGT